MTIGAAAVRDRYRGKLARAYDDRRAGTAEWHREHGAVLTLLSDLQRGSRVLDIPVGTGRYAPIYHYLGLRATGMDTSPDMLAAAQRAAEAADVSMLLRLGDALAIDAPDRAFDAVVCTRLVNWFTADEMMRATRELIRVASVRVVMSIRFGGKERKGNRPHSWEVFEMAVRGAGARVARRLYLGKPEYQMVELSK